MDAYKNDQSLAMLLILLICCSFLFSCVGTIAGKFDSGELELNQRLRADMGPSAGMDDGRFFADGSCIIGSSNDDDCNYISQVRGSLVDARSGVFLNSLRKSDFLWVAGRGGFSLLSYEFIFKNFNIVEVDDPSEFLVRDATGGSCYGVILLDAETRRPGRSFRSTSIADGVLLPSLDVSILECTNVLGQQDVEGRLTQITDGCTHTSVREAIALSSIWPPARPEVVPLCLINIGGGAISGDVSYFVKPTNRDGSDLTGLGDVASEPFALLPNLKTVPTCGTRTISRPLEFFDERLDDDGSRERWYRFRVGINGPQWSENFSPNIFVSRVRVRKGDPRPEGNTYLPIDKLKVNRDECDVQVPGSNDTAYDITMCSPAGGAGRVFRATPAYRFTAISAGQVDDADRITWEVRVRTPPAMISDNDRLFIEFELSADPPGVSCSNLFSEPSSRDLGTVRDDAAPLTQDGFSVYNDGIPSVWIESIRFGGSDAAEFGTPLIYRTPATGTPLAAAASPATLSAPFMLQSGSAVSIKIRPAFQSIGLKRTELIVAYRDMAQSQKTIRMPVAANVVSTVILLEPASMILNATPGIGPRAFAGAQGVAILNNAGPIAFQRLGFEISGPQAASFQMLASGDGSNFAIPTDLSQPFTIEPGASEVYRIGFYPKQPGISEATLTIQTNEGEVSTAIAGYCDEICGQPPDIVERERPEPPPLTHSAAKPKLKIKLVPPTGTKGPQSSNTIK